MKNVAKHPDQLQHEMLDDLKAFVDLCFARCDGFTFKQIATMSGLSPSTIYRLHYGAFTPWIRFETVRRLGHAAGLTLVVTQRGARVRLIA